MRKLFKKSLACVLAVALCLTAMVGVLSVSADVVGTLTMVGFNGVVGDTATVTATFTAPEGELISESFIDVAVSNGAKVESVALAGANADNEIELNDAKTRFNIRSANGLATAVVTITLADATAAGTYTVTLTDVTSATDSQSLIKFATASADAVIVAPHVHTEEEIPAVPATCEGKGFTAGVKCSECDEVLTAPTEVPALGHKWNDGEETTAPDCENAGVKTFTCLNDGTHTKTEAIDALGHNMEPVDAVPATCTTPGTEAGEKCSRCDATTGLAPIPALEHNYGDNLEFCANGCGTANPNYVPPVVGPEIDPALVIAGASPTFGTSSLEMQFRIRNSVLTSAKYDHVDLVIIPQKYDLSTKNLVKNPVETVIAYDKLSGTGTFRTYDYKEMMLYELALNIDYKLRAYDAQGNVVAESQTYTKSVVSYLKNDILGSATASADLKKVAVDMLVVCEEARIAMAKEGTDLETDSKVSVLEGVDLTLGSQTVGTTNSINDFDAIVSGWGTTSSDTYWVSPSASIEKVPVLSIRLRDRKAFDDNKLVMKYSYTSAGSAGYVEKEITGAELNRSGNFVSSTFSEVGLHDSNANITVEFIYDGVSQATLTYSIETYLAGQQTNATIGKLATALLKLGASFRTLKGY